MADREQLPIVFFDQREIDNLRIEGGGSTTLPKWMLSEEDLANRSKTFIHAFEGFRTEVLRKQKEDSLIPLVVTARIIDDAIAKAHRIEIHKLFQTSRKTSILGLAEANELVIKLESDKEVEGILAKVKDIDNYGWALSAVEGISRFTPFISKREVASDYKVRLINYQDYEQDAAIGAYFTRTIKELGLDLSQTQYSDKHVIYNIKSVDLCALERILQSDAFEAVFAIEPMPVYRVVLDTIPEEVSVDVSYPEEHREYATIGILDNGIADIPHLEPWIVDRWSPYPDRLRAKDHGTFVSGIAVYGDFLEGKDWVGTNGSRILDACVFPNTSTEGIGEDELIANIQEAVKTYHDSVKVWNLSISVNEPIDESSFSDFAVALDALQEEYNVLICKSIGNCGRFLRGHPKGRILQGADSVRALAVGSIAHRKSDRDLADVDNPSPFTRVGRGPSYIIKPEVVHYGGNAGIDSDGVPSKTGVRSFGVDGLMYEGIGTSHSTPRVAALAAGLYQETEGDFDPLLVKGLIVHSASYSQRLTLPTTERVNQVGFGRPKSVKDTLYNAPHEMTLILRSNISRGEYIDIMDFPMPECLVDGDYYRGQIVATLVYNPILEAAQRAEYCQSNLDVKMGTFDFVKDRDTTRRNILNPEGRDGSGNVFLERHYSKTKMKSNRGDFALRERLLIQYGDKYYPCKKYAVDLSEMTDGNQRKYLTKDKRWFLSLRALFRHHIELRASQEEVDLTQEFCLIITIRDPSGTKPVYDQVIQKLDEYNFWHSSIELRSEVRLRS